MLSLLPSWIVCEPLPLPSCHQALGVRERIGRLSMGKDLWWSYSGSTELREALSEALGMIEKEGWKFFDEHSAFLSQQRTLLDLDERQQRWLRQWTDLYTKASARTYRKTLANLSTEIEKQPAYPQVRSYEARTRRGRGQSSAISLFTAGRLFLSSRILQDPGVRGARAMDELMAEARRLCLLWSYQHLRPDPERAIPL
jgi:hypothetical protein